jgi:tetratricopeptide (TPR) repeat protein
MNAPSEEIEARPPGSSPRRAWAFLAGTLITLLVAAAYSHTFRVPFLFDDESAILANPSIADLSHLAAASTAPKWVTTARRPLLNLSFALNYAYGRLDVRGYHAVNLAIHVFSALALFGLVRRTLELPSLRERFGHHALWLAAVVAALWALDPLQTESVTYISQRAESMAGLFVLLTLYFFARSRASRHASVWLALSVTACLLGLSTKEVAVTAPLLVLLYDCAFCGVSPGAAVREKWGYYTSLAASWLWLGFLVFNSGLRESRVGTGFGITPWDYACTEAKVIARYVGLSLWPHPLVFDYGPGIRVDGLGGVWPYALAVVAAVAAALLFWRWSRPLGFVATSFFVLLGPTSSFVPLGGEPMAESRLYLPLAAVLILGVAGVFRWIGIRGVTALALLAIGLGYLTLERNRIYLSEIGIWQDTVAKAPGNYRAHENLGDALLKAVPPRLAEAASQYEAALAIKPDSVIAQCNLGAVLGKLPGQTQAAIGHLKEALRLNPNYAPAHVDFANILANNLQRTPEAISHYEAALRLNPGSAETEYNFASLLVRLPARILDSIPHYEAALRDKPDFFDAHLGLAIILSRVPGRMNEAIGQFKAALALDPKSVKAHYRLGIAYLWGQRWNDAKGELQTALEVDPKFVPARVSLSALNASLSNPSYGEGLPH